jgi:hypothetical protein
MDKQRKQIEFMNFVHLFFEVPSFSCQQPLHRSTATVSEPEEDNARTSFFYRNATMRICSRVGGRSPVALLAIESEAYHDVARRRGAHADARHQLITRLIPAM